jgi:hypothetical protein
MYIYGKRQARNIIFDGNSLTNLSAGNNTNGMRYPLTCYSSIAGLAKGYCFQNYSVGSRRTAALTAEFATKVLPYGRQNDWIIFWEITNEAHDMTADTLGTQLYANVVAYCQQARNYGFKVACLTGIARDMPAFDDPNITDRIIACNNLMRADSSFCDVLIDVGALAQFDQKADTLDTTYYDSDRTHLTTVGYDLIASTVFSTLSPYL